MEVIIAVIILSVGLLGMAGGHGSGGSADDPRRRGDGAICGPPEHHRAAPSLAFRQRGDRSGFRRCLCSRMESRQRKSVEAGGDRDKRTGLDVCAEGFPKLALSVPDTFTYRIIRK